MRAKTLFGLLTVLGAAFSALQAQAFVISVPGDHATLTAAIDAATTGDTILITNTAVYPESITIGKPLIIRAAANAAPVIAGTGTDTFVVKFVAGSQGTQFGAYDGGLIKINADSYLSTSTAIQYVQFQHATGLITMERVKIEATYNYHNNTTPIPAGFRQRDTNEMIRVGTGAAAAVGNIDLRYVEIKGGSHGIRLLNPNNGNILNIENCLISTAQFGMRTAGSTIVNISNSIIRTENLATWPAIYYDTGFNRPLTMTNSWLHTQGKNAAITSAARRANTSSFANSVFSVAERTQTAMALGGNSYGENWTVDHCDIISSSTNHLIAFAQRGAAGARSFNISNSNLVNQGVGALVSIVAPASTYTFGFDGAFVMQNNNHYNPNTTATASVYPNPANFGFTTYTVQLPVAALLPNYANRDAGNFTYTTPALLTAGTGSTAMGANRDYSTMAVGAVPVELAAFSLN